MFGLRVQGRGGFVEHQQQRFVAHEAARQRELLPLAEAHLHALRPSGAELRLQAVRQRFHHVLGAGTFHRCGNGGRFVHARRVAQADRAAGRKLEAEEVLERAGEPFAPLHRGNTREVFAIDENAPGGGFVHLGQELHQRRLASAVLAHQRHHRARRQFQIDVLEHERLRTRIGEGNAVQRDAFGDGVRRWSIGLLGLGRGVVFQPRHALGAVHPDAAQEADFPHRGADVGGEAPASRKHQQHFAGRSGESVGDEDHRAHVASGEHRPAEGVPGRAAPPRLRHARVPAVPRLAPFAHQPFADAGDAHFLAGRSGGGGVEQVPCQAFGLRAGLLGRPFHGWPPGGRNHRRQREQHQHGQRRMHGHQPCDGHAQAQNPAAGAEQRHVHVVEHEDLVAQDGQAVEIVGAFVVFHRGHARLQRRHVRFQGDGHAVAEASLRAVADDAQHPGGSGGERQAEGGDVDVGGSPAEQAVGQLHQQPGQQRIGQRRQQGEREGDDDQRRFGAVAALHRPPHRGQGGRQVVEARVGRSRRGRFRSAGFHARCRLASRGHRGIPLRLRRSAGLAGRTSSGSARRAPSTRRGCRVRRRGRSPARRCGRRGARWRSGAK